MKDTKINITLIGWAKKMLLPLFFIVGTVNSFAGISCNVHWYYQAEGQSIDIQVVEDYVVFDAVGFNGEIFFQGIDIKSFEGQSLVSGLSVSSQDDKFYTSGNLTQKFYAQFDEESGKLSIFNSSPAGIIAADKKSVCKGENVKLSLVDVTTSEYTTKWGLLNSMGVDTTWLDAFDNQVSILYPMDTLKSVHFVSKITSKSEEKSYVHTIPVSPALNNCGFTVTSDLNQICLSEAVEFSTDYVDAEVYQWGDNFGNSYGTTTTPTNTIRLKTSGDVSLYIFADGLEVGSKTVKVRSMADCGYSVTAKRGYVCLGRSDLLSTDFVASSYKWTDSKGNVVGLTTEPSCRVTPTEPTVYHVYADNDFLIGEVSVDVRECTFFIASRYPIASCLQDTNYLMASGTAMLEDIDKNVFQWESSLDGVNWKKLPTSSYRLSVVSDTNTYYRVTYDGMSEQLYYPKPDCNSVQYCNGLETKTLFYETFGFFMASNVYFNNFNVYIDSLNVQHKTSVYDEENNLIGSASDYSRDSAYYRARANGQQVVTWSKPKEDPIIGATMVVDHTKTSKMPVRDFIAPDPNGYVVAPSEIIDAKDANFSNQFVGTDGHLFLTENPMLQRYDLQGWLNRPEMRLQDGYYAIVMNPDSCDQLNDGGDNFITTTDATGNKNGAMLFVNAGKTEVSKAAIYAQKVSMSCEADRFNFSMSVRNAVVDPTQNPVNLTVYLLKEFGEDAKRKNTIPNDDVLTYFETGDVEAALEDWTRLEQYVELEDKIKDQWVVIYNNGQSGDGNDILMDDIVFSVCIPKANLVATMNGQVFSKEVVSCSGDKVTLVASQESAYINDPIYLFQYQKIDSTSVPFDTTWVDVREYSATSPALKENKADVETRLPQYWGTVDYRVIIADNYESARKVADGKENEVSECEFTFHIATTKISIRNTYGGEMAPRDSIAFCNIPGEEVNVVGERLLTLKDHTWTMSWLTSDSTLIYEEVVKGISKDSLSLVVRPGNIFAVSHAGKYIADYAFPLMDSIIFRAEDEGGCQFFQNIKLHAKMNLDITPSAESIVDCNSATLKVTRNYSEPSLVFDWSSVPGVATPLDDSTQTFVPSNLNLYSTIEGSVTVRPVNVDNKYCFLQDSISVPYVIHNGHYTMEIASSKDPVCVSTDEDSKDVVVLKLTASVNSSSMGAEEAAKIDAKIKSYKWHLTFSDGTVIDTVTASRELTFANKDLLKADGSQIKASKLSASVVATETDVCQTIAHPEEESLIGVEIREGGFTLKMAAPETVCLLSDNSNELEITITPATALLNISSISLLYNDQVLKELTDLSGNFKVTLDDATYPSIFTAGNTGKFLVQVYDETCKTLNLSNPVVVKYNGYDWSFNSPDSCLSQTSNLFNVVASIDSAKAVNHIQSYSWSLNGQPFTNNGFSFSYLVPNSMETVFQLTTSDGICPDVTHSLTTNVSINYSVSLSSSVNKICSTESATVHASITPATSDKFIKSYTWYAIDAQGEVSVIKNGIASDSVLVLNATDFPELFLPGNHFQIYVVADDGICSSVQSLNNLSFDVNVPFTLSMSASHQKVCYTPGDEVMLNVSIMPADAAKHISSYTWTRISKTGILTQTTTSQEALITDYAGWMEASDSVYFTVSAYDGICVSATSALSDGKYMDINTPFTVTLVSDKAFACTEGDQVFLTGVNSGSNNPNVSYSYSFIAMTNKMTDPVTLDNADNLTYHVDYPSNYSDLAPGDFIAYQFIVNDDNVCGPVTSSPINVMVQTPFKANALITRENICMGEYAVAGLVSFEPAEAARFVQMYTWQEKGVGTVGPVSNVYNYLATSAGKHTFFANITDGICYGTEMFPPLQSTEVSVDVNTPLSVSLAGSAQTYCVDGSTAPVVLTATVNSGDPLSYSLYYSDNKLYESVVSTEKSYSWTVLPNDDVHLFRVVVDDGICSSALSPEFVSVDVHHPIDFEVTIPEADYRICLGQSVHFYSQVLAGQQKLNYLWHGLSRDVANQGVVMDSLAVIDTPQTDGMFSYSITASDGVCPDVTREVGPVEVLLTPYVNIVSSKDQIVIGSTVDFTAEIIQGEPTSYYWLMDTVSLGSTVENSIYSVYPPASAVYTVYVTNGVCPATYSSIEVGVLIPTAFTPHRKDGMNDVFMKGFDVKIFDRYGMKVFEGNDGWEGQKGAVMADPGVYYCTVLLKNGELYKGTIEIVKID